MGSPYIIAAFLALAAGLFAYSILVPRNIDKFAPDNSEEVEDNIILRITTKITSEFYNALPAGVGSSRKVNPRVELLLQKSGNPWGLKSDEFIFFQWTAGILGLIAGWLVSFLVSPITNIPWWGISLAAGVFGFLIPQIKYSELAKLRDLEFTRHLPEILDLLIIPLVAGSDINNAIRKSLPNMPAGVLRDEFQEVLRAIDTGKTTNEALDILAERAPNESIAAFVRAVQEANTLQVPMVDTMKSRAKASRADFFGLIYNKTAQMPSKLMLILFPTLVPALIIVVVAPAVGSLMSTLGG